MLNDAALTTGSTAIAAEITHLQLHNGAPGTGNTANVIGSRAAAAKSVDADGDITLTASFAGLTSNTPVTNITYWTAAVNGATRGGVATSSTAGDVAANFAGEYNAIAVENSTATS